MAVAPASRGATALRAASRFRLFASSSSQSVVDVSRPSVTWGALLDHRESAESRARVCEYLRSEGINTAELQGIELPSSVDVMSDRLHFLRSSLGLDNKALNHYPLAVACSVAKNMRPVLGYLEKLGIERKHLPALVRKYPMILHASVAVDLRPVISFLKGLDIRKPDLPLVLLKYPDLLGFRMEGTMSTSVAYLISIGISMREIGPMLTEYPEILGMRVATMIKPKIDYLLQLGLPLSIIARIIERRPYLLGYVMEDTIKPTVECLLEVGVTEAEIPGIIAQYPEILGRHLRRHLEPKMEWFQSELGVERDDIPRIIAKMPPIFFVEEPVIRKRVSFLRKNGFGKEDLSKMFRDLPQIAIANIDQALKPNLNFLRNEMKRPLKDVVDFPAYLTYSLERRIRPRYTLLTKKKKHLECSLKWFLNCSDAKFHERLATDNVSDVGSEPIFCMGGALPSVAMTEVGKKKTEGREDDWWDVGEPDSTLRWQREYNPEDNGNENENGSELDTDESDEDGDDDDYDEDESDEVKVEANAVSSRANWQVAEVGGEDVDSIDDNQEEDEDIHSNEDNIDDSQEEDENAHSNDDRQRRHQAMIRGNANKDKKSNSPWYALPSEEEDSEEDEDKVKVEVEEEEEEEEEDEDDDEDEDEEEEDYHIDGGGASSKKEVSGINVKDTTEHRKKMTRKSGAIEEDTSDDELMDILSKETYSDSDFDEEGKVGPNTTAPRQK